MRELSKLEKTAITLFAVTFMVWLTMDVFPVIVTPLSPLGVNHWVMECVFMFCVGYRIIERREDMKQEMLLMVLSAFFLPFAVFVLPVPTFSGVFWGLVVGCLFLGTFSVGMWCGFMAQKTVEVNLYFKAKYVTLYIISF